jgi:hypothetical protein
MTDKYPDHGRKFHTFLFRHCVRSTKKKVKLYNGDKSASNHASDYTKKDLPQWNTPSEWCTETAMDILQSTGSFLLENILLREEGGARKRIRVQIISDTSQRDVDTSLALSLGMANASFRYQDLQIDGLDDLRLDHALFDPLDDGSNTNNVPRCAAYYSPNQTITDIERRLKAVPPPEPGLEAMLALFEKIGGVGHAGTLFSIKPPSTMYLNRTEMKLAGAVNIVKIFAQMLFYSRAGDIDPPFLPKATLDDVYQALEWVHWSRSVLSIDNVEAATQGAVVADAILQSLQDGQYGGEYCADDYDVCATLFVGHDSTIDAVATALGLRWKLRPPYRSGRDSIGEYVPTPPGGAMYFMHKEQSDIVELAYLYPVYSSKKTSAWKLNKTGSLESVPMALKLPIDSSTSAGSSELSTIVTFLHSFPGGMRERMHAILTTFPGATGCYQDIIDRTKLSQNQNQVALQLWDKQFCGRIIVGTLLITFSLALTTLFFAKKIKASTGRAVYSNELLEGCEHMELT